MLFDFSITTVSARQCAQHPGTVFPSRLVKILATWFGYQ